MVACIQDTLCTVRNQDSWCKHKTLSAMKLLRLICSQQLMLFKLQGTHEIHLDLMFSVK